jgi:putative ABC transport system permease protein
MKPAKLARLVGANSLRNRGELALSAFGIAVGIGAFVFFLGLSGGVRNVVLGEIFPLERLEVVAPATHIGGKTFSKKLDDALVARIRSQPGVNEVVPRMRLNFPASGSGHFEGKDIRFEVGGFCDGIEPSFVADERFAALFQDWGTQQALADAEPCQVQERWRCQQPGYVCGADRLCRPPPSTLSQTAPATSEPVAQPCLPAHRYACADSSRYYCDQREHRCLHRVPVIISRTLLELYNSSVAGSHGMPAVGGFEEFIAKQGGLERMRFTIGLGRTYVAGAERMVRKPPRDIEGFLVGISDKAMPLGMTIPIGYVERWNREFLDEEAATSYSSVLVTLHSRESVAGFSAWLRNEEHLELADSQGERFAVAIFIVTALFVLISFVIVGISAVNIAHTFFMLVSERRREIGLLRAVGATRRDVTLIILGEASLIGLIGGGAGVAAAVAAAAAVDWASAKWLPNFPFKPDSYFDLTWPILLGGLGFAVLFCVLGGLLPARRAGRMEPAQALASQ